MLNLQDNLISSLSMNGLVVLSDLVVSMLAIGPKVRGFIPGRGCGYLRAIKIRSTPPFKEKERPKAASRNILLHVKNHLRIVKKILRTHHSLPLFLLLVTR
jgi:hypothetical protein